MKKITIMTAFFILFLSGPLNAKITDEVQGGNIPDSSITDREMREDTNLHAIQSAWDNSKPRENVKHYIYDLDITYKIRLREFMNSTVVLPKWEKISGFSIGDSKNFQFVPLGQNGERENMFQVYAKYPGADTNLTIFGTSGNVYSIYLRVDSVKSKFLPDLVIYISDKDDEKERLVVKKDKEEFEIKQKEINKDTDYLRSLSLVDPTKINYNYSIKSGNRKLQPIRIFDDGFFTYFQFSEENNLDKIKNLPGIYKVVDGFDVIVNTRVDGGTIIAESVNEGWTLRNGDKHLCIRQKD